MGRGDVGRCRGIFRPGKITGGLSLHVKKDNTGGCTMNRSQRFLMRRAEACHSAQVAFRMTTVAEHRTSGLLRRVGHSQGAVLVTPSLSSSRALQGSSK